MGVEAERGLACGWGSAEGEGGGPSPLPQAGGAGGGSLAVVAAPGALPAPDPSRAREGDASPGPPARACGDGWSGERQRAFVEALAEGLGVRAACARVGMSHVSAYALRRRGDARGFAQAWDAARAIGRGALAARLEDLAWQRAVEGTVRQHFYHGELVAETREYSDKLLVQLLAAQRDAAAAASSATDPAAGPATDPATLAAVAADWDGALARLAAGQWLEPVAPAPAAEADDGEDDDEIEHKVWEHRDGALVTNWPPPPHFAGAQGGQYGAARYRRTLAPEELAGLDRADSAAAARLERRRRRFFGLD